MCYALFIGTDEPLLVEDMIDSGDRFHLEVLQPQHSVILDCFSKPNVYYAASWQGCGCGFFPDSLLFERKKKQLESNLKTTACVHALGTLLSDLLTRATAVELFLSWEGELDQGVSRRVELTPADFEADVLPLEQRDFAIAKQGLSLT